VSLSRFSGRTVLVTGAASGIGRATVDRLGQEGAQVYCVDLQAEATAATVAACRAAGIEADGRACDVSDELQVDATVAACIARFGKLDALCNVAGTLRFDHFHEIRTADWLRVLGVNLNGTFFMCRAAVPHLLAVRGNIVNVASTAATHGQPWAAAYAASKGGVLALTHTIATDYAKQGLRANAVLPCDVATPIFEAFTLPAGADMKLVRRVQAPMGSGRPEHVASAIAMLASDDGAHMNGAEIRIDGATWA
jgi:meso-butanediol dehydrogenase / (S,S)-butanediol dehydrogenase / diacetyl reductase